MSLLKSIHSLIVVLLLWSIAMPVSAVPIRVSFTGIVFDSYSTLLGVGAFNGQTISGSITFRLVAPTEILLEESDGLTYMARGDPRYTSGDAYASGTYSLPQGVKTISTGDQWGETQVCRNCIIGSPPSYNNLFTLAVGYQDLNTGLESSYLVLYTHDFLGSSSQIFTDPSGGLSDTQQINWFASGAKSGGGFNHTTYDSNSQPIKDQGDFTFTSITVTAVPEPETYVSDQ